MKAYIIMSNESRDFVQKITPVLKGAGVVSWHDALDSGDSLTQMVEDHIKDSDIVIIVVGESFSKSKYAKVEMQMALTISSLKDRLTLFPIILDDNPIPEELNTVMCARCRSDSDTDIQHLSSRLQKVILEKKKRISVLDKNEKHSTNRSFNKYSMVAATMAGIMSLFAAVIPLILEKTTLSTILGSEFTITIITALIGAATVMVATTYTSAMRRKKSSEEKEEVEQYSKKLKEAIAPRESKVNIDYMHGEVHIHKSDIEIGGEGNKTDPPEIDALGLMRINLEDIKEFYTWSQKQAKGAFRLAVSMCIAGFIMMAVAILLPIAFNMKIEMAIIPAIGGAIAELIAGTALFVYRSSLSQLNHYHKALHEDERFLSSVNLLSRFSTTEAQDEMLKEIIRSEIQMNIISVSMKDEDSVSRQDEKKKSEEPPKKKEGD